MDKLEIVKLLALVSEVSHKPDVSEMTVEAWFYSLQGVPYELAARAVVRAAQRSKYIDVADVVAGCRPALAVLERDRRIREIEHDRRVEFLEYTGRTDFDALTQSERDKAMRDARQAHWDAGQKALTNGTP